MLRFQKCEGQNLQAKLIWKRLNNGHFYLHPAVTPVVSVQQQISVLISVPILGLLKKYPIHHNISEKHINFRDSSSLVMDHGFKGLLGE